MATTRNSRTTRQSQAADFGLLANGSSGGWDIAIDESTSGADRWHAQIEGPSITLHFEIPAVDVVGKMIQFLKPRRTSAEVSLVDSLAAMDSLIISKDKKIPVTLVKDDEYADRFFFVVGPGDHPIARFVIAGSDIVQIADALGQVEEDLGDED